MLNNLAKASADNSMIDTVIGYNETKNAETKQRHTKRVLAARRAIETHHEQRQLSASTEDYWLLE